jgi:hypothetical protein
MTLRWQRVTARLLVMLCLAGCGLSGDRLEAEQVLAHHFDAREHRKYESAVSDYDDLFFEAVSRVDWGKALADVDRKLGNLQHYDVSVHGLESRTTAGPGLYLKFKCKVSYPKHTSDETFFMYRRLGATRFKILGHEIDSLGLASQ